MRGVIERLHTADAEEYVLSADVLAPRRARQLVRAICREHDWMRSRAEDAALVVGGLVAIAVRRSRTPVTLHLTATDNGLAAHVNAPVNASASPVTGHDRAVWDTARRLSSSWGYSVTDTQRDLWADFRLAEAGAEKPPRSEEVS